MQLTAYAPYGALRRVALRSALPLIAPDAARTWVHFTVDGVYEGHSSGAFEFNREVHSQLVANFNAQKNPIPLTYEHPQYRGDGQPIPAAGWIHELDIRNNGLWGLVEFTSRAADMIRNGEYRYCSVVVSFESTDRKSGKDIGPELYEVGLTNVPFIDGQEPIRLSRRGALRELSMKFDINEVAKALKDLPPDATEDQVHMAIDAELLRQKSSEKPAKEDKPKADAPAAEASAPPVAEMSAAPAEAVAASDTPMVALEDAAPTADAAGAEQLASLMGEIVGGDVAAAIAFVQENKDAIAQLAGKSPDSGTPSDDFHDIGNRVETGLSRAATARITKLSQDIEAMRLSLIERDEKISALEQMTVLAEAEQMVSTGKLGENEKEFYVSLKRTNPELVEQWYATRSSVEVPTYTLSTRKPEMKASRPTLEAIAEEEKPYVEALTHVVGKEKAIELARKRVDERRRGELTGRS